MPAKSKSQQRLFGMAHACEKYGKACTPASEKIANTVDSNEIEKFAKTKHKKLPEKKHKKFKEWLKEKHPN